jgi:DNA repair exonuclease SbcCD ATPase subunit
VSISAARLIFDFIRWKNFLSTGNVWSEIKLNDVANALIIGDNGAGKSTLLDAICFVLYNKPFRKIKKGQIVNSINAKECVVEIEFHIGKKNYKVIRGIKPDIFEIWVDGILLNQNRNSRDYQSDLEDLILGMNFKTFTQIVVAGNANFLPFMQSAAADRRSFIEDLLNIKIFAGMLAIMKARFTNNKDALEKNRIEAKGKVEKKALIEKNIAKLTANNDDKILDLKNKNIQAKAQLIVYATEIEKHALVIKDNTDLVKDAAKQRNKHDKLIELRSKIKANHSSNEEHYKFFDSHDNCPTCKQAIEAAFKDEELLRLESKLTELEQGLKDITSNINDSHAKLTQYETYKALMNTADRELAKVGSLMDQVRSIIKQNEAEIVRLSTADTMITDSQDDLSLVTKEIDALEDVYSKLLEERTMIMTALDLLKDGGIKTKIIKQYLPIINKTINKYLQAMGFAISFELDETFDETIKARYRDEFSYANFSEGEKMRIDLALMFTWRTIAKMKNSVSTNLLVMDEIFDGSLDASGIDDFLKIISGFTSDSNVFIISHNQIQMVDKFKKVYKATKKKNFSHIEVI